MPTLTVIEPLKIHLCVQNAVVPFDRFSEFHSTVAVRIIIALRATTSYQDD